MDEDGKMLQFSYPEVEFLQVVGNRIDIATYNKGMEALHSGDETPADAELRRPQFGMHRFEWPDDPGIEFHISHGDRIRLFRDCGLEVEDLIEIQPSSELETRYSFVDLEWARKWPSEEAWIVRKK